MLSLSILILDYQCKEGASDINISDLLIGGLPLLSSFRYDEQHLDIDDFKPCNFFEHASCVAKMKNEADHSYDHACLPACDHTSIHQESIHVCIGTPGSSDSVFFCIYISFSIQKWTKQLLRISE